MQARMIREVWSAAHRKGKALASGRRAGQRNVQSGDKVFVFNFTSDTKGCRILAA
jgi:hypothetical protein